MWYSSQKSPWKVCMCPLKHNLTSLHLCICTGVMHQDSLVDSECDNTSLSRRATSSAEELAAPLLASDRHRVVSMDLDVSSDRYDSKSADFASLRPQFPARRFLGVGSTTLPTLGARARRPQPWSRKATLVLVRSHCFLNCF